MRYKQTLLSLSILFFTFFAYSQNPFIRHMYTADPSAHVFDGRLYVYPSHDLDSSQTFDMIDYPVFSTENLVDWTDHGIILSLNDVPWATEKAWAPDCNFYNGKYYFYFPTDRTKIGVAVSESPIGPFKDPLGQPLLTTQTPGVVNKRDFIDPTIFIDDDNTPYLFFGQLDVNVVKLNQDMISFDDSVTVVQGAKDFFEAIWVHKYKDTYYLSYSTWGVEGVTKPQIVYATAKNVLGPYKYQGVILDEVNSGTNHHSIVEFNGNWILFYHNSDLYFEKETVPEGEKSKHWCRRSIAADFLTYNEDGSIKKIIPSKKGISLESSK